MEEIKFNEVEISKLNLAPGDTLMVKLISDDVEKATADLFKRSLQDLFPNNRVMVMFIPSGSDVKFEVVREESGCAIGSYCADCSCGKKEAALANEGD